ncbi:MAG: hypothetical protein EXS31_17410 [Pedosphaera sp.]|nr:hypothetical protein [Pedosphaera sp.]
MEVGERPHGRDVGGLRRSMMRFAHRWMWLLGLALVTLGAARLRFDVEIMNLLPGNLGVARGIKAYQQHFANARELIITVETGTAEEASAAASTLAQLLSAQTNLVADVTWQPVWATNPIEATELIAYLWLNQSPSKFAEMASRLVTANRAAALADARERLATSFSPSELAVRSYDPYSLMQLPDSIMGAGGGGTGDELFTTADGLFRMVFVEARPDLTSYRACRSWFAEVKQIIAAAQRSGGLPAGVQFHFTGRPAFVTEIAGGMEDDIAGSCGGTLLTIAVLFWLTHRRLRPLFWLLFMLVVILAGTAALGGLFYGAINVVSMGFAAILLGLAEDFGIVIYQESRSHPDLDVRGLRHEVAPGIFWSAVTTAGAFLTLNLSTLPGLGQLGSLVAIGIILGAVMMVYVYLPPLLRIRRKQDEADSKHHGTEKYLLFAPHRLLAPRSIWIISGTLLAVTLATAIFHGPGFDRSTRALKPRNSDANATLDRIKARFGGRQEPLWVLVAGKDESDVSRRLSEVEPLLTRAVADNSVKGFTLPTALWPVPKNQQENRAAVASILSDREGIRRDVLGSGFTTNALRTTDNILNVWQAALGATNVFWPTNHASRWVINKVVAPDGDGFIALGLVHPTPSMSATRRFVAEFSPELERNGVILSGWELLGSTVFDLAVRELPRVLLPIGILVVASLWLAFRRWTELALSLVTLVFSGLCLWAAMGVLGWDWNLMNLMALPLLLGMGVDFGIHIQMALRRYNGDLIAVRRSVGKALLLAGATTVAGFASLAFSTNAGMASLGRVCALGIALALMTAVYLLPVWWKACIDRQPAESTKPIDESPPAGPSRFYGAWLWRGALCLTRTVPTRVTTALCWGMAKLYWGMAAHRREVVIQNLLPVLHGDRIAATLAARNLFEQFGRKLADLWRFESGRPVDNLFGELSGWEHFTTAQARAKGVLLVTPHLGNWEIGSPLLARRGVSLLVITLAEPGYGLTELRRVSRARWGVETLVIGQDPFAFVEVIKRLEAGATVALLIDRPPEASAVTVELFGRPFQASIAAAELARASGCAVVPVYLPRIDHGYAAHVLPEVAFDRRGLNNREARERFTQEIVRAFEPAIRQHPDQWFHFVPIWPVSASSA